MKRNSLSYLRSMLINIKPLREIAFNRVTEEIKQRIESDKRFDYPRAFHSIDDWNYGFIDKKNLKSFFR